MIYKHAALTTLILVFFTLATRAQQQVLGKWETPDKDIIEFYMEGHSINGKQISAGKQDGTKNNNKIVARDLKSTSKDLFEGAVIDPKDNKIYHGRFNITDQGTKLELKVKWGFINFKEIWKRIN